MPTIWPDASATKHAKRPWAMSDCKVYSQGDFLLGVLVPGQFHDESMHHSHLRRGAGTNNSW